MPDETKPLTDSTPAAEGQVTQPHAPILNQTLGELLQNNSQAQGMVTQAMQISPDQLQQLLNKTGNNQLMNMTIGDLFKNGVVKQAVATQGKPLQMTPEQFQQLTNSQELPAQLVTENQIETPTVTTPSPENSASPLPEKAEKQSFLQKLKNFF